MLQSCGIPYRTENEHLPSVLAGIGVTGFNHTDFYILQDDYEEAFRIVTEYAEHKRTAATPDGAIKTAADIITVIAAAGYVPGKDETAGIVVFKYDE